MKRRSLWICLLQLLLALLLALPTQTMAANGDGTSAKKPSQEELAQLLAPIALYPDELVSQILMASTYPLEVVQADRWAKSHKQSAGDTLTKQLEKEPWDPSVKSLVNFPTVLAAMSEKLDVTTKIGDAFLSDQKGVMETIQVLRKKAHAAGNLKTTKEQQVIVEKEVIIIKPADPQVIYVPTYSPTVVYGTWMYPSYPPYYYYPPPPPYAPAYTLAVGIAIGAAWNNNYHGNCDWHGNTVNVNNNYNINHNQNANINRGQGGQSAWKHNPQHRKGVAYKDGATAKQYGQSPAKSQQARSQSRGYGSTSGGATGNRPSAGSMDRGAGGAGTRPSAGSMDRGGRDSAFGGGGSGSQARAASDRGMSSRQSSASSFSGGGSRGGSFSGGGGGGRSFGGGGGGRGGGRR
jgi:hypothetical protein